MRFLKDKRSASHWIQRLLLCAALALPAISYAALVALANSPLTNATTTNVLPNLMFIMDNSGSMGQDYTPDWIMEYNMRNAPWTYDGEWNAPAAKERNCRDSADDDGLINPDMDSMDMCVVGDVPFMASAINSQYYNPEIRYLPGVNANGSSKASQTEPTSVLLDGYGKHNQTQLGAAGTTINLTTDYPDRVWCTKNNPTAAELIDTSVCRKNSDYLYPDTTYKYGRDNNGTTANKNVLGIYGAPYYYSVVVTEYCSEAELRNCVSSSTPTGSYTFPAKARYCSDKPLQNCQSIKTSTFKYPRYPGASTTAVAATGYIIVGGTSKNNSFTSIKINNVEVLGATVSWGNTENDAGLAALVAAQINSYVSNPEYTASIDGANPAKINITSTLAAGASANGDVTYTTNNAALTLSMQSGTDIKGGVTGTSAAPYTFVRTDIVPATTSYPKATSRTDCAGSTCTYAEEITNFGNWYAYYRTRMQAMKSAVSHAFKPIGSNYRVGFINICKGDYLPVASFDNSTAAIPAVAATGYIIVGGTSTNNSFSSIKVNGVEILGATVSWGNTENDAGLAALVAAQINSYVSSPDYTAQVDGTNPKRINLTSTLDAGATANGDVTYTTNSGALTLTMQSGTDIKGGVTAVGQKSYWYDKLFSQTAAGCGTPLRSALATVGRVFAGKEFSSAGSTSGTTIDPIQYSCQQNFALLTTDGYWNGDGGVDLGGNAMGNMDAYPTPRPKYEGPTASTGSLADVAKYYYDTDIRHTDHGNCTGSLGIDVCENNVFVTATENNTQQHMTTFTLGLGVDGTIAYVSDYKTATSGDYYKLRTGQGGIDWPVPASDSESAVDDLWHAAVSGEGTYFSAKDPAQLAYGLSEALASIGSKIGAASAAATSTLTPVSGNNFAYVASYATVKWQGNLEARTINIDTGVVSQTANWCVENVIAGTCASPGSIVADSSSSSLVYYCATPVANADACSAPGVYDGTNCNVQMSTACTGTMLGKVGASSDTRTIFKNDGAGALESFEWGNLDSTEQTYFSTTKTSQWSHWATLTSPQQSVAAGEKLVQFLRGQTGYEYRTSNPADNRLYRFREATLGDALESQPIFIGAPVFAYVDPGYSTFKTAQASRAGTVYIGANDGMLHAFNAENGNERWAFVPTAVMPNLWKLADRNYATAHTNYVNGPPVIADICVANCDGVGTPEWKTILVGGLNAGGRSYYALDITAPDSPTLLWEITAATSGFSDLGFSYSVPVVTKKQDGTWVVLFASGYNNVSPGTGKGYLFVVEAATGNKLSQIDTGVGDTTTPSGLAKIAAWNDYPGVNNVTKFVYGGDLLGNLWRFNIDTETAILFATLKDSSNNAQPITMTPSLGKIKGKRIIFAGTGKYLEVGDLTDTSIQSIYAISDIADIDADTVTLNNARTALVQQSLNVSGSQRTGTNNTVDWTTNRGWYVDLLESGSAYGERLNVDMMLVQGTLIAATIVPSNTVCSPGGYSWLNFFNYATGGFVDSSTQLISAKYSSPIVGFNIIYINKKPVVEVITASSPTPQVDENAPFGSSLTTFSGKRVQWRELLP